MIYSIDYFVIGFYLLFMVAIGAVFRRFSKTTSDYYRGGGTMLWWMTGASAMMSAVSAWSFTGAAGAIYETGTLVAVIYLSNAAAVFIVFLFTCQRFRRMRVVTYAEAIRRRYGGVTEQFYVWLQMPVGLIFAGISLNAVGVFIAAIFQTEVLPAILVIGFVVIVVAMLGGAWSVVAGDFMQLLLTLLVMVLAAVYTLKLPEIGGLSGLVAKVPAHHFHWGQLMKPEIVALWCVATFLNSILTFNNMAEGAARFLTVKDGSHARKAAAAMVVCFVVIPFLLLIPPMAATIVFPDLHEQFPRLGNPHEAAFVAICLKVMPPGVIGLMMAGIFAVAMASMDTGLNRNSGLFIRNFYLRFLRPLAGERELLMAAKTSTVVFGALIILIAGCVSEFRTLDLFNLALKVGSLFLFPLMVPMVLGVFVRGTPGWSGWTTVLVGFAVAWTVRYGGFDKMAGLWIWPDGLSARESETFSYSMAIMLVFAVGGLWYWLCRIFATREEPSEVSAFFADLSRPINVEVESPDSNDHRQYRTMGRLCLCYGGGITCFSILPSLPTRSREAFVFCGGIILIIGAILMYFAGRTQRTAT